MEIKRKTVIILGSSRSKGETYQMVQSLRNRIDADLIDLLDKDIGRFDYDFKNQNDDFLPTIQGILEQYDTLIFATPVYWYSMSGVMKDFFDRISDLLKIEKDTGRKFRGKNMAMLCCSAADDLVAGFNMPFVESANYLGMSYLGDIHGWIEEGNIPEKVSKALDRFAEKLS